MKLNCIVVSLQRYLIYAVLWSFSGDGRLKIRAELGDYIRHITTCHSPLLPMFQLSTMRYKDTQHFILNS